MDVTWYYAQNGVQNGPISEAEIRQLALGGRLLPSDLVWRTGMATWVPAAQVGGLFPPPGTPGAPPPPLPPAMDTGKRIATGVCAILLGSLGIHKFILGYSTAGIIMLLTTLVGGCLSFGLAAAAVHVIAIIEGIIYLSKSDQDFYQTYVLGQRPWF